MNIEQRTHTQDEWEPPSNEEWVSLGTYLLPFCAYGMDHDVQDTSRAYDHR